MEDNTETLKCVPTDELPRQEMVTDDDMDDDNRNEIESTPSPPNLSALPNDVLMSKSTTNDATFTGRSGKINTLSPEDHDDYVRGRKLFFYNRIRKLNLINSTNNADKSKYKKYVQGKKNNALAYQDLKNHPMVAEEKLGSQSNKLKYSKLMCKEEMLNKKNLESEMQKETLKQLEINKKLELEKEREQKLAYNVDVFLKFKEKKECVLNTLAEELKGIREKEKESKDTHIKNVHKYTVELSQMHRNYSVKKIVTEKKALIAENKARRQHIQLMEEERNNFCLKYSGNSFVDDSTTTALAMKAQDFLKVRRERQKIQKEIEIKTKEEKRLKDSILFLKTMQGEE